MKSPTAPKRGWEDEGRRWTWPGDKVLLFGFFLSLIILGGVFFSLPVAWKDQPPPMLDAWFLAVSSVCVTGLTPVPISSMSLVGQVGLLLLVQLGGLGIITVTALLFVLPGRPRLSLENRNLIRDFFVTPLEFRPRRIIQKIVGITVVVEGLGFLALWAASGGSLSPFSALFHTVSAFNNAGFSLFDESLWALRDRPMALGVICALVVAGGLGYVVLANLFAPPPGERRRLHPHSLLVLVTSGALLLAGFLIIFLLEVRFTTLPWTDPLLAADAWLCSVMSRTAGFNFRPTADLSPASQIFLILLMLIGAGPASTSGGVKVTTFALFAYFLFRGHRPEIHLRLGREEVRRETIQRAVLLLNRFSVVYAFFATALILTERVFHPGSGFLPYFFETASALGTVGLSLGVTPALSWAGKIIIMAAMFTGRVGLLAFIVWSLKDYPPLARRPACEVLLG